MSQCVRRSVQGRLFGVTDASGIGQVDVPQNRKFRHQNETILQFHLRRPYPPMMQYEQLICGQRQLGVCLTFIVDEFHFEHSWMGCSLVIKIQGVLRQRHFAHCLHRNQFSSKNNDSVVFDPLARLDDANIADELDEPRSSFERPWIAERHDNIGEYFARIGQALGD